jgi:type IV pilus assembly protein PilW
MYLDTTQTSQVSRSLARVQESGRIALDLVARDLRSTGFAGCAYPLQELAPAFDAAPSLDGNFYESSLRGAREGGGGWNDMTANVGVARLGDDAVGGSDAFQIRRASGPGVILDADMTTGSSNISTDSDQAVTNFRLGNNALITNCVTADVFTVGDPDGISDNEINHQPLSFPYREGSRVLQFNTVTYWVGDTGRTDQRGNAVWSLYQNGLEVVTGIERLQVLYGVREGGGNLRFDNANDLGVDDWREIVSVQVGLLISDEQNVLDTPDTKTYDLPGVSVQPAGTAGADATYPADGRLRTTFAMTVNLRNNIEQ